MAYRKLTPEEKRVILNKCTECPFTGEIYRPQSLGHLPLMRHCTDQKINLIRTAADRVLMMRLMGQSGVCWMLMAVGLRLCTPTAMGIWGMYLKVRISHRKTRGTASTLSQWFSGWSRSFLPRFGFNALCVRFGCV